MPEAANNLNDWWYDPVALFECKFCKVFTKSTTHFLKVKRTSTKLECVLHITCQVCHRLILDDRRTYRFKDGKEMFSVQLLQF
jgi:hypothetical protein